jgi:hypothetical protein
MDVAKVLGCVRTPLGHWQNTSASANGPSPPQSYPRPVPELCPVSIWFRVAEQLHHLDSYRGDHTRYNRRVQESGIWFLSFRTKSASVGCHLDIASTSVQQREQHHHPP